MGLVATDFGISEVLTALGIEEINKGTSTGSDSFANGEIIASFSPVDGNLIAKVISTTPQDYEKTIQRAEEAFSQWRILPAPLLYVSTPVASCDARTEVDSRLFRCVLIARPINFQLIRRPPVAFLFFQQLMSGGATCLENQCR